MSYKIALPLLLIAALCGCTPPGKPTVQHELTKPPKLTFLSCEGRDLVNEQGDVVQLRGVNAGCWLLIEPWIVNLAWQPGVESEKDLWDLMGRRFGEETKLELIQTYRDNYFTEQDVERIANSGMNCIRLPIWWRAVSDPAYGGDMKYVDQCVAWCEKYGLYLILDLHGCPGGQSDEDKIVGEPTDGDLWKNENYKVQTIEWWKDMARRYRDNPVVAGYDLINEAMSAQVPDLMDLYDRIYREVRAIDPRHVIFLEDGLLGFHRMPRPIDRNWENVAYSFHYYPQDPEEAYDAEANILHKFQRMALFYDVPILVGEFNTMHYERGGNDTFRRYIEIFDYYGWSWTFWTYKKIEDDRNIIWGLYGYYDGEAPWVDLNKASAEEIKQTFRQMRTEHGRVEPLMQAALLNPVHWQEPAAGNLPDNAMMLSLADAFVMPLTNGELQLEWKWNPPNAGYWKAQDRMAWVVDVPQDGIYRLGINMANQSDANRMSLWIDGTLADEMALPNANGWRHYINCSLGDYALTAGRHVFEMAQADNSDGFINIRYAWINPSDNDPQALSTDNLHLSPVNLSHLEAGTPIRGEWFNNPPNFGYWKEAATIDWLVPDYAQGVYNLAVSYATPNEDTELTVLANGKVLRRMALPSTGSWIDFAEHDLGEIILPDDTEKVSLQWTTANPEGAGNLRFVNMERVGK